MASMALPPSTQSGLKLFVKTQFLAKPKQPPKSMSLAGQTAIITGSNVGIGLECARVLLSLSLSHLIMAVRSIDKGERAAAPLRKSFPAAKIETWALDMSSYPSIQSFASKCESLSRLDVVILNAAVFPLELRHNPSTGHEEALQVNYLSTALLSILLLPVLKSKSPAGVPGRLTLVSTNTTLSTNFPNHAADPLFPVLDKSTPGKWNFNISRNNYGVTKILGLCLLQTLSELVASRDVVVNAVDPGFVRGTGLHRDAEATGKMIMDQVKWLTARSLLHAAWTYVDAAFGAGANAHGGFFVNWELHPFPTLLYSPEGKHLTARVWRETMKELEFANVQGVLDSLSSSK